MNILALDLSFANTGWALGAPGETPVNGSIKFARRGIADNGAYFVGCRAWLLEFIAEHAPEIIALEGPLAPSFMRGHTTTDTARALMGLIATVELTAYGRDVREHAVSAIRQFFLGSSKIKSRDAKQMTFDRCVALGWQPKDKDAADALALWAYQVSLIAPAEGIKLLPLFWRASA